jgi:hypothetical protein
MIEIITVPGDICRTSDTTALLRGRFRHNPHHAMAVVRSNTPGKSVDGNGNEVVLSARANVISAVRLPSDSVTVHEVSDGDLITVDGEVYRIADDRPLSDPRLIRAEG